MPNYWVLHLKLVHLTIAILNGGVFLMLWSMKWPSQFLNRVVSEHLLAYRDLGWQRLAVWPICQFRHTEEGERD